MKESELREMFEAKGYRVKHIQLFRKSFRIRYSGPDLFFSLTIREPLETMSRERIKKALMWGKDENC